MEEVIVSTTLGGSKVINFGLTVKTTPPPSSDMDMEVNLGGLFDSLGNPATSLTPGATYTLHSEVNNAGDAPSDTVYMELQTPVNTSIDPCHDGGTVSATLECPFTSDNNNSFLNGDRIVEIKYVPKNLCIGTVIGGGNNGDGVLGACGDQYGNNAANGAFDIVDKTAPLAQTVLVNRYWTNQLGGSTVVYFCSSGNFEGPVYTNYLTLYGGCSWGGILLGAK
jgi:hypothetical protein